MPAPAGLSGPPIMLMELQYAGRVWRFATKSVSIVNRESEYLFFAGGLPQFDLRDEIAFLADGQPPEISIEMVFPEDISLLISQNHPLDNAPIEISLHREGDTYEERVIFRKGYVKNPVLGPAEYPVAFTIDSSATIYESSNEYPDPGWVVNDDSVNATNDIDNGSYYPTVFGRPGVLYYQGAKAKVRATPAILINVADKTKVEDEDWTATPTAGSYYLIATGAFPIRAKRVRIHDATALTDGVHYVYRAVDNIGNVIYLAKLVGGSVSPTAGHVYFCSWDDETIGAYSEGGSQYEPDRVDKVMEGAGDILHWALGLTGLPVQWDRVKAASTYLNQFKLGGYWNEPCRAYDWIRDNLLPILPISLKWDAEGLYPVVWKHWATKGDAIYHLKDLQNCSFYSVVDTTGNEDIINRISLEYALDPYEGSRYRFSAVWAADQKTTFLNAPPKVGPIQVVKGVYEVDSASENTRTSVRSYGERSLTMQSDLVWDRPTADMIVAWQIAAKSKPYNVFTIEGDWSIGHLNAGDIVLLSSEKHHLDEHIGHIRSVTWKNLNAVEIEIMVFST